MAVGGKIERLSEPPVPLMVSGLLDPLAVVGSRTVAAGTGEPLVVNSSN